MSTTATLSRGIWVQGGASCHQSWLEIQAVQYRLAGWRMRVIALAQHQGAALPERWVFGSARGRLLSSSNDELFQSAGILVRWQGLIDVICQQDYLALRVHDGDFNDVL